MKNKYLIVFSLLITFNSCSTIIKSKAEIVNFKIELSKIDDTEKLSCKIFGNTRDSALWIKRYSVLYEGNHVYVIIEKSMQRTGISDPYYIQFIIPENIEKVYLGYEEVIWKRS